MSRFFVDTWQTQGTCHPGVCDLRLWSVAVGVELLLLAGVVRQQLASVTILTSSLQPPLHGDHLIAGNALLQVEMGSEQESLQHLTNT